MMEHNTGEYHLGVRPNRSTTENIHIVRQTYVNVTNIK
jgi:hypothetical protein